MKNCARALTPVDTLITLFDKGLRQFSQGSATSSRAFSTEAIPELSLTETEKQQSIALMRVNHAGEVAAQALYHGQAFVARDPEVAQQMQASAAEEQDHLHWCHQRVSELGGRTSYLDPLWFMGSFMTGIVAGLAGDKWSLGFIAETENQVVQHINHHLEQLSTHDQKSRAILLQMREDEQAHGHLAMSCGGAPLPTVIKTAMHYQAKVMTTLAYYI